MGPLATIFGLSGPELTPAEVAFFKDADPWAFILFARNVETPEQMRALCASLRASVGRDALIFIDQEGGRVRRMRPPHWRDYPSGATYATLHSFNPNKGRRAIWLGHRLMADDLRQVGVTADCAPVLDLPQTDADPIISDRAFGTTVADIVSLADAAMSGLMAGGVAPVIKHIPGHGRARVDSHLALPEIDAPYETLLKTDLAPFNMLHQAPMAMTAHAVYSAIDNQPLTLSSKAIKRMVREDIGFDGLLMTDDLDMKALRANSLSSKAEQALSAGCDVVLQCNGVLSDMEDVARGAHRLSGKSLERALVAEFCVQEPEPFDREAAEQEFDGLLQTVSSGIAA